MEEQPNNEALIHKIASHISENPKTPDKEKPQRPFEHSPEQWNYPEVTDISLEADVVAIEEEDKGMKEDPAVEEHLDEVMDKMSVAESVDEDFDPEVDSSPLPGTEQSINTGQSTEGEDKQTDNDTDTVQKPESEQNLRKSSIERVLRAEISSVIDAAPVSRKKLISVMTSLLEHSDDDDTDVQTQQLFSAAEGYESDYELDSDEDLGSILADLDEEVQETILSKLLESQREEQRLEEELSGLKAVFQEKKLAHQKSRSSLQKELEAAANVIQSYETELAKHNTVDDRREENKGPEKEQDEEPTSGSSLPLVINFDLSQKKIPVAGPGMSAVENDQQQQRLDVEVEKSKQKVEENEQDFQTEPSQQSDSKPVFKLEPEPELDPKPELHLEPEPKPDTDTQSKPESQPKDFSCVENENIIHITPEDELQEDDDSTKGTQGDTEEESMIQESEAEHSDDTIEIEVEKDGASIEVVIDDTDSEAEHDDTDEKAHQGQADENIGEIQEVAGSLEDAPKEENHVQQTALPNEGKRARRHSSAANTIFDEIELALEDNNTLHERQQSSDTESIPEMIPLRKEPAKKRRSFFGFRRWGSGSKRNIVPPTLNQDSTPPSENIINQQSPSVPIQQAIHIIPAQAQSQPLQTLSTTAYYEPNETSPVNTAVAQSIEEAPAEVPNPNVEEHPGEAKDESSGGAAEFNSSTVIPENQDASHEAAVVPEVPTSVAPTAIPTPFVSEAPTSEVIETPTSEVPTTVAPETPASVIPTAVASEAPTSEAPPAVIPETPTQQVANTIPHQAEHVDHDVTEEIIQDTQEQTPVSTEGEGGGDDEQDGEEQRKEEREVENEKVEAESEDVIVENEVEDGYMEETEEGKEDEDPSAVDLQATPKRQDLQIELPINPSIAAHDLDRVHTASPFSARFALTPVKSPFQRTGFGDDSPMSSSSTSLTTPARKRQSRDMNPFVALPLVSTQSPFQQLVERGEAEESTQDPEHQNAEQQLDQPIPSVPPVDEPHPVHHQYDQGLVEAVSKQSLWHINFMRKGTPLLKYQLRGKRLKSNTRVLKLDALCESLTMESAGGLIRRKPKKIPLSDIQWVLFGPNTRLLKSKTGSIDHPTPWRCFSLVLSERTVDFVAENDSDAQNWVQGLQQLIYERIMANSRQLYSPSNLLWKKFSMILQVQSSRMGVSIKSLFSSALQSARECLAEQETLENQQAEQQQQHVASVQQDEASVPDEAQDNQDPSNQVVDPSNVEEIGHDAVGSGAEIVEEERAPQAALEQASIAEPSPPQEHVALHMLRMRRTKRAQRQSSPAGGYGTARRLEDLERLSRIENTTRNEPRIISLNEPEV